MPIYSFIAEDGEEAEFFFASSEAPRIGSVVEIDGADYTRVPDIPRANIKADRHFVAWSQPTLDADGNVPKDAIPCPRYDRDPNSPSYGHGLFHGMKEVREWTAKTDGRVTYGE